MVTVDATRHFTAKIVDYPTKCRGGRPMGTRTVPAIGVGPCTYVIGEFLTVLNDDRDIKVFPLLPVCARSSTESGRLVFLCSHVDRTAAIRFVYRFSVRLRTATP